MAFTKSLPQKSHSKSHRRRLTDSQVKVLEASFIHDKKLEPEKKAQLARDLGLQPRQVAVWYQNKKARWRTQSLEQDYHALQLRFDSLLEEKRAADKELLRLRTELDHAKEMLGLKGDLCACLSPSSGGDDGTSIALSEGNSYWENSELYADFMFAHSIS